MQERIDVRIHPTAEVSDQAEIGPGTRIWNQCQVRENACIGRNCIIGKDTYIDFGVHIGDNVKIQNASLIYHGVTIESGVFVGPNVIFTNDKNPRAINPDGRLKGNDDWLVGPTRICYGASIGAGSVVLPNITIGQFALVGAGAVVTRNVPDYGLVMGNPARLIGYVCKCAQKLDREGPGSYICPACGEKYSLEEHQR
jgi:acetyltransferase-like isoleucine patch superfamily enzyme